MRKLNEYLVTIDTIYPDGYERERVFRDAGDMVEAQPFPAVKPRTLMGRIISPFATWFRKRRSRLSLRELTPEQLHDIGLSRCETTAELEKAYLLSALRRSL